VLASVLFSTLAGLLVAMGLALIPRRGFHLGHALNSGPPYLRQHYLWVTGLLAAQVVVACLLALLANRILKWQMRRSTGRPAPRLKAESAWTPLLSAAPEGTSAHVWLKLRGGVELRGKVVAFGHEIDVADRELVLGKPLEMRSGAQEKPHELLWQHVVVEGRRHRKPCGQVRARYSGPRLERDGSSDDDSDQVRVHSQPLSGRRAARAGDRRT
jgi:hypothetical protein